MKSDDGAWVPGKRPKKWEYGKDAQKKYGEQFAQKERKLFTKVVSETEKLGLALLATSPDLSRRLLHRVILLDPSRLKAAKGVGLRPLKHGLARADVWKAVANTPVVTRSSVPGIQNTWLQLRTTTKQCGSAIAETVGDDKAAEHLARLCHQTQMLTSLRFGLTPQPPGWVTVSVASSQQSYSDLLDRSGAFDATDLGVYKAVGSARAYTPRHFMATYTGPMGDPRSSAALFVHMVAEHVLFWTGRDNVPAWLHEAVALDAALTLLGQPGIFCITYEESQGLTERERTDQKKSWNPLLLRRAGDGDLAKFGYLVTAQVQALGEEDIFAAHLYYRYLLLEKPDDLPKYLSSMSEEERVEPEAAVRQAFGGVPDEVEAEMLALFLGR